MFDDAVPQVCRSRVFAWADFQTLITERISKMSRAVNKVMLLGHVGAGPEIRTTPAGVKVAKVSLATNRTWKDHSGQEQEKVEWHRLTFWDRLADVAEKYVHKGDRLYVEGRLEYSTSETAEGATQHWTTIVVRELVMLGGPGGARNADPALGRGADQPAASTAPSTPFAYDDDLPF